MRPDTVVRTAPSAPVRRTAAAVAGVGVRLPGAAGLAELLAPSGPRTFAQEAPEHAHALAAATAALGATSCRAAGAPGATATVWATSTAGLADYAQTCADIPVSGPTRVSPRRTAHSAFTAPATELSVRLGLDGPYLNVTGGRDAGAHAVTEAIRMLTRRRCERVVVGGSAEASAWRSGPDGDPAEGALCLVLRPEAPGHRATTLRPVLRARWTRGGIDALVRSCLARMDGPANGMVLSASAADAPAPDALAPLSLATPLRVEDELGDLGAAGGVAALIAAVARTADHSTSQRRGPRVLALALGNGNAVALEATSPRKDPR
ncbi:beta-ketoacyl synthase N-terminal-like domain-containing protein [Streptomyces sp. NPDC087440]|uniref:beta-ketoacyl synthase N-terminal-like domain-containing protein n=1 Tax=Streptomyces sp. NPDC087440 TaxID=3365790 RepID=UPI0038042E2B